MNFFKYLTYALPFLLAACATDSEILPADVFVKYYGTQDEQRAVDFQLNDAGEIVILGTRRTDDETANDFYLLRVDQDGNLIDEATIGIEDGDGGTNNDLAYRIKIIDQGYLIVGSTAPLDNALIPRDRLLYWAHLDENFQVITQVIDTVNAGSGDLEGTDIYFTSGDSVLVSGYSTAYENNQSGQPEDGTSKMFVGKWSLNGNLGWKKTYGFAGSNDLAGAIFETANNEIMVFGVTDEIGNDGEGGQNVLIYQLNQYGTSPVGQVPKYGTDGDDVLNRVVRISGGYAIVGTSFTGNVSNPFLITVDNDAQLISKSTMEYIDPGKPGDPFDGFGLGVTRTASNDFVVVGRVLDYEDANDLSKNDEMMFIRTTQSGVMVPESINHFGLVAGNDEATSAITLADGSILVLGTSDFGSGVTMVTLMKMNDSGLIKD